MFGLPQDAIVTFMKVFSFGIPEPKNGSGGVVPIDMYFLKVTINSPNISGT